MRIRVSVALILVLLALSGCSQSGPTAAEPAGLPPRPAGAFDASALQEDLRVSGAEVFSVEATRAGAFGASPSPGDLAVWGRSVQVYDFATSAEASRVASAITADGTSGPFQGSPYAVVEWKGVPHLFRRDRLIVIYLAESNPPSAGDSRVLASLEQVMGRQFAGMR